MTTISKVEIDRLSVTSSKSFEAVLTALKSAIGRPDMVEFANAIRNAQTFAKLERTVHQSLGNTGLMMFMEFDQGGILRKETGLDKPKIDDSPLMIRRYGKYWTPDL